MKLLFKIIISILLSFSCVIIVMSLATLMNKGNSFVNMVALVGLIIIFYLIIKTRLFTKFKFKNKNKNEKNS